ncbi:hypothetical protein PAHAL_9G182400 [Panicum hallii]|uniref:Aminotransferase-like plant mobile domain-containing protein n=1 Tax=Panicum hallii TaxID=206008 RepID=A0A2T8I1M3_9POAL|nr:hypothetical protein PAHAL_9G182400 [Panicum hallii]
MRILQLWVWERLPELRPEMAKSPAPDVNGVPRVARWHDARSVLDTRYVYGVLMSPKEFEWRPYGSSSVALQPKTCGCWVRGPDITRSKALLSFARCLRTCELVGMKCIEKYRPHPKTLAFIVPDHKPGVTVKYAQWWERYSSACATAVANSVKTQGLCVLMHVDTSIRIHRTASDAAEELEDEIPLVERLNSIIKMMHKQHTTEFSVKSAEQELIVEGANNFRSISATDEFVSSLSMVDGLSCGSVTKMALNKCLQQTEEEDLVISDEEKNSRPECGDLLFHNIIQAANMTTLRQEPHVVAHSAAIQTYVGHSGGPTEEMQKRIVARDKVHKDKIGPLRCNEKGNEDVLVSNQELESVIENLAEANRKKSGNSERPSSSRLVDGIIKQVGTKVCTKTVYYLSRFYRTKDAWDKDANCTGGNPDVNMPRRAVGTMEMIKMASALRMAEIAELKENIDRLKEEILALEAAATSKGEV